MSGIFKSLSGKTITFKDDSEHLVADNATVTLNGKSAVLGDLRAGDSVSLSGDPATSVSASRGK